MRYAKTPAAVAKLVLDAAESTRLYVVRTPANELWASNAYWLIPGARVESLLAYWNLALAPRVYDLTGSTVRLAAETITPDGKVLDLLRAEPCRELAPRISCGTYAEICAVDDGRYYTIFSGIDAGGTLGTTLVRSDLLRWITEGAPATTVAFAQSTAHLVEPVYCYRNDVLAGIICPRARW